MFIFLSDFAISWKHHIFVYRIPKNRSRFCVNNPSNIYSMFRGCFLMPDNLPNLKNRAFAQSVYLIFLSVIIYLVCGQTYSEYSAAQIILASIMRPLPSCNITSNPFSVNVGRLTAIFFLSSPNFGTFSANFCRLKSLSHCVIMFAVPINHSVKPNNPKIIHCDTQSIFQRFVYLGFLCFFLYTLQCFS